MAVNINNYVIPLRLKLFRNSVDEDFTILDVGCGYESVLFTKKWYPRCRYFGLDLSRDYFSSEELSHMEKLFIADLDRDDLSELPDAHFDVIVMSHVIEHVRDGLPAVERLTKSSRQAAGSTSSSPRCAPSDFRPPGGHSSSATTPRTSGSMMWKK
jgi:SAM-dependent methyltransferase